MESRTAISRGLTLGVVTVLLVTASLAGAMLLGVPGEAGTKTTTEPTASPTVNVFGLASTAGQGTHLVELSFTDTRTGAVYTAPVSGGKFSIDLPNGAVYDVVVRWQGNYSWQTGSDGRGGLTVNMSAGSMEAMSYNLQVETPPTVVGAHGTIVWSLPTAHPVEILYTASDGESFSASVQNATFSTRLPNMMDYQVKVFWQYDSGSTDYLSASNQTIDEGIGVTGVVLVVG